MLPVSLYNRSVLSADGAALSSALAITALCLRDARKSAAGPIWERSLWMTFCALSKQPQIVFVLLELMTSRLRDLRQRGWDKTDLPYRLQTVAASIGRFRHYINVRSVAGQAVGISQRDFLVRDHNEQQLAYIYFENEPGRPSLPASATQRISVRDRLDALC